MKGKVVATITKEEARQILDTSTEIYTIHDVIGVLVDKLTKKQRKRVDWWTKIFVKYDMDQNVKYDIDRKTLELYEVKGD